MGLFTGRKSSVEDVEGVRVPPGFTTLDQPMSENANCCGNGCQCAQHHATMCEPVKTTQIGPDGQVITTEAYHTSYACYDPNCTGEGPCTHTIQHVTNGDQMFTQGQQMMAGQQIMTGGQQVMAGGQQPGKFQRVVTTTTTTTTSQPTTTVYMGVGQPQITQTHMMAGTPMMGGQVMTNGQLMAGGQQVMTGGQQIMTGGQQKMGGGQQMMGGVRMMGGVPTMQMVGNGGAIPIQMLGGAPMAQAVPVQMVQGVYTGTAPVLVNQSGRPMPAMINGIPVVIPKKY